LKSRIDCQAVSCANVRQTFYLEENSADVDITHFTVREFPCHCVLHEDTVVTRQMRTVYVLAVSIVNSESARNSQRERIH
jgi:hypothetical protein